MASWRNRRIIDVTFRDASVQEQTHRHVFRRNDRLWHFHLFLFYLPPALSLSWKESRKPITHYCPPWSAFVFFEHEEYAVKLHRRFWHLAQELILFCPCYSILPVLFCIHNVHKSVKFTFNETAVEWPSANWILWTHPFVREEKKWKSITVDCVISDDEVLMMGSHPVTFPQPPEIKDHRRRAGTLKELIQHFACACVWECVCVAEAVKCRQVM